MTTAEHAGRPRTGRILAVISLALMTVVSAVSGLNVALPELARETGATQAEITWIVDAYTIVFAGLLLFAGALGDRFGRRGLLAVGLTVFAVAAGLGMVTNDPHQLIALRALMGIGAAAIMPSTLSVITTCPRFWRNACIATAFAPPLLHGITTSFGVVSSESAR